MWMRDVRCMACAGRWATALLDFFVLDLNSEPASWTELTFTTKNLPPARFEMGFTSAGGKLYIFGGTPGARRGDAVADATCLGVALACPESALRMEDG